MTSVKVMHELLKKQLANNNYCKNIFYISHNSKWRSLASKLLPTNYIVCNLHIHEGNICLKSL